jgi:voltage-gated sodium channel
MKNIFLNDRLILGVIMFNVLVLILLSFNELKPYFHYLEYSDNVLTIIFFLEMVYKIRVLGWKSYIRSGWNQLDFVIVVLTTPSLIFYLFNLPSLTLLLVLRAIRVLKFFRFLKFVPNLDSIISGVGRALKSSVFVLLAFFLFNLIVALFNCYLFREVSPEYFGNVLKASYTTFKMFTLEGWYEVPETITANYSSGYSFLTTLYFTIIVICGGIFGLSIVNAIFVDEMMSDNNRELENRITRLENKIELLIDEIRSEKKQERDKL